jgi:hypothetical protein
VSAAAAPFQRGRRLVRAAAGLAGAGVVLLVLGALLDPGQLFPAYLAAYAYVVSVALGALVFLMIIHAMGAGWPTLIRRLIEAIVATLPILAALFVPLLFGLRTLYPWLRPETIADPRERELVALKAPYLNPGGFVVRAAVFWAVWLLVGHWLRRWSEAQDADPAFAARRRLYALSGILLPLVALCLSFASFDWLMSLTPAWSSTMYPVYFFAGGFLGALALLTVLTAAADRAGLLPGVNPSHYYALGRLLLAFVIFWAYIAFFQLMLIWMANRPDEVTYYLPRAHGAWWAMSVILVVTQFGLPFFLLLNYDLKRRRGPLAVVAAWILAAHYLDAHWLVMPTLRPAGSPLRLVDLGALLAVGGVTVGFGVLRLRGRALVPFHDPALPRALRYDSR